MKRTFLKRIGKVGKNNLEANKKIKEMWEEKEINYCELKFDDCLKRVLECSCFEKETKSENLQESEQ